MQIRKTHKEYMEEVAIINPAVEVVGKYIDTKTKIKHRCKKCNHVWCVRPNSINQGSGCPECKNKCKTHKEYVAEIEIKNPNIKILGGYVGRDTKTSHRCKKCNHIWDVKPLYILGGSGCPKCATQKNRKYIRGVINRYYAEHRDEVE